MSGPQIVIEADEPFGDGKSFGAAGPYRRLRGTLRGAVDPAAAENQVIVDLEKAPRNAAGLVEYAADLFLLRPQDPGRGSGILVNDVTNRGRKMIFGVLDDAVGNVDAGDPKSAADAGLGFTLGRGHSIVWSGWDPGAPKAGGGMAADFPLALENGRPMTRRIRDEFHIGTRGVTEAAVRRLSYPASSLDKRGARLTVRQREGDPRVEIPPEAWEFVDNRSIRLLPAGSAFAPSQIYDFWYEATGSRVLGLGLAVVRDLVSMLRYEPTDAAGTPNPLTGGVGGIRHALAFGVSQSGRFLRTFIEAGMNRDMRGRPVFDGVLTHVAGAGKVFANHSFGMPGRTATQHEDRLYPENWFPFSTAATVDPFSGRTGSLSGDGTCSPKLIEVNTSTEYWQKAASLVHADPIGENDLALPANSRAFMIAGTQHGGRAGAETSSGPCLNPRNPHSASPALRALFVALEEWVVAGVAPPASRVPTLADGTAIPAASVAMPPVVGLAPPPVANRIVPPVDWIDPPADIAEGYGTLVSAVDVDGNEVAGIRLPPIAVPLGTYTGWNVYTASPCELCDRDGSLIPFAGTRSDQERAGDPRPSLEARYGTRANYVAQVAAGAAALVAQRLLLPSDAAAYVAAAEGCDRF